jgi:hypothetical protein
MAKYWYFSGEFANLYPGEVFVFGSNLAGHHGSGAAKTARVSFGAKYGVPEGMTGDCYAIPTKDDRIQTLALKHIKIYVDNFKKFAEDNPQKVFLVTKIGCGLAGYANEDIAPMFVGSPGNCWFDEDWREHLE